MGQMYTTQVKQRCVGCGRTETLKAVIPRGMKLEDLTLQAVKDGMKEDDFNFLTTGLCKECESKSVKNEKE